MKELLLKGLKGLAGLVTTIVNSVLLAVVYLLGVGLTALLARLVGKRFLRMKPAQVKSYWVDLNIKKRSRKAYQRQF